MSETRASDLINNQQKKILKKTNGDNHAELRYGLQSSKLLVARGGDGIGIVPPLELVTCSHVFSPQLPLSLTCKPLHPVSSLSLPLRRTCAAVCALWSSHTSILKTWQPGAGP